MKYNIRGTFFCVISSFHVFPVCLCRENVAHMVCNNVGQVQADLRQFQTLLSLQLPSLLQDRLGFDLYLDFCCMWHETFYILYSWMFFVDCFVLFPLYVPIFLKVQYMKHGD